MATNNRISIRIENADLQPILAAVAALKAGLADFTLNLSPEEKAGLPKIGDKTIAFDGKCVDYMADRPDLVPGFIDADELDKDRDLIKALLPVLREIAPIVSDLEGTILLAYSDLYVADLAFYQNVKQAAKRGVNGAEAIYDDLRERFPGRPRTNPEPTPDPAPDPL